MITNPIQQELTVEEAMTMLVPSGTVKLAVQGPEGVIYKEITREKAQELVRDASARGWATHELTRKGWALLLNFGGCLFALQSRPPQFWFKVTYGDPVTGQPTTVKAMGSQPLHAFANAVLGTVGKDVSVRFISTERCAPPWEEEVAP